MDKVPEAKFVMYVVGELPTPSYSFTHQYTCTAMCIILARGRARMVPGQVRMMTFSPLTPPPLARSDPLKLTLACSRNLVHDTGVGTSAATGQ